MKPEALLALLVNARTALAATPKAEETPFLLQRTGQSIASLTHPALPDGELVMDEDTQNAFTALIQWGYLAHDRLDDTKNYTLTRAGLDFAQRNANAWDGVERRRRERRGG